MAKIINHHQALIYIMVTMSGVDGLIGEKELKRIGRIVEGLPVFKLGLVKDALPPVLHDTGYALACEVAAADLMVWREEMRFLSMLRDALDLDKLITAAIERGVIARHRTYPLQQR
jgi:uncharacterized membrane protein YebE (DUF533 family)